MVDFSDRKAIEHWLAGIEPAERWREVAVPIAVRAALRVLPLLVRESSLFNRGPAPKLFNIVFLAFHAVVSPWAAGRYPAHVDELRAFAAGITIADATPSDIALAAAYAAATIAHANSAVAPIAADAVAAAFRACAAAAYAAESDVDLISSGRSGAQVAEAPLWPTGVPDWAAEDWQILKTALLDAKKGWEVWTDWYEGRLAGDAARPPNEALEVARATIPNEIWKQGPAAVNAEIKRLIVEHGEDAQDADDSSRDQSDFERILAIRAALRILPLFVAGVEATRDRSESKFLLSAFRALAVAWAKAQYSSLVSPKESLAAAREVSRYAKASGTTAYHVGNAAAEAAFAAGSILPKVALRRASNAHSSVMKAMVAAHHSSSGAIAATAYVRDQSDIIPGVRPNQVAQIELWAGRDPPAFIGELWELLKKRLRIADEGWDVWIDWYEARLDGRLRSREVELAYVNYIRSVTSTASAWQANSEIKRLIDQAEEPPPPEESLHQRPAAFQFRVVDDKIDVLPEDAQPIDARNARDLYDEAKRKARDLKHRLQRAQADVDLRAHVDLLLTRLGESYPEIRPGLMLSVLRSLESDVRAYDSEEGRKELSAALLSSILDLAESVRDLCAIFPRSREIEAEAISLGLPLERMPEIRSTIDDIIAKVGHSDGVTEDGREAINASAVDLAHQRGLADEAKQSAYFLVHFANFTRAGLKHLKTVGAVFGRELGGLSADGWRAVRRGAPKGIERGAAQTGRALIVGGVAALMHVLGSDIAALGSMVAAYAPLHEILERISGPPQETPAPNAPPVGAEEEAPRAPASRKPTSRRSPAKTPARKRVGP